MVYIINLNINTPSVKTEIQKRKKYKSAEKKYDKAIEYLNKAICNFVVVYNSSQDINAYNASGTTLNLEGLVFYAMFTIIYNGETNAHAASDFFYNLAKDQFMDSAIKYGNKDVKANLYKLFKIKVK